MKAGCAMRKLSGSIVLFGGLVALSLPAVAAEDFQWRGRVNAGQVIEIKGVNGSVRAEAASGNEVEVVAVKRGRRSDPNEVKIAVVEHGDGVTVCAVYPSPDPSRPNECQPGSGGRMNTRNNDVDVEFTVRVPAGVRFAGRTVNGAVEAEFLAGDVSARTVNGSVTVSTTGHASAHTVNGSIKASLGSASWNDALEFETVNGSITVSLPAGTDADLSAKTVNGEITSDLPLTVRGRFTGRELSGTLGRGGRPLVLKTVNGSLRVRVAS